MNIAEHVITKVGRGSKSDGVKRVAAWTKRHPKTVYCWMYPRERGGTGGVIPADEHVNILNSAKAEGIDLSPADFFPPVQSQPPEAA